MDGTALTLVSALTHDVHLLNLGVSGTAVVNGDSHAQCEILYDPAGGTNWSVLIPSLQCGYSATVSTIISLNAWYSLPLFIKAGTSLGVRGRTSANQNVNCAIAAFCFGQPNKPDMWWCGQGVEVLGANTAGSKGTDLPLGVSSSYGAWTTVGTSSYRYGAVAIGIGGANSNNIAAAQALNIQYGYNSTQLPGSLTITAGIATTETMMKHHSCSPTFCDVPSGTVWQARSGTNSASGVNTDVIIVGVY